MLRQTILDFAEQKANYLGLRSYRHRNMSKEGLLFRFSASFISHHYSEMMKLGPDARSTLFIQLANFPNHYLVIVITDERFKYALITTKGIEGPMIATMVLEDIAWIDSDRIHQAGVSGSANGKPNIPLKQAAVGYRAEKSYSEFVGFMSLSRLQLICVW
jgi:mediator of RNA polymerase II transcription subunit 14